MPKSVVKKIQAELPSYKGSGMSIMEISHRSSLYVDMQNEAESNLRQLMNVPDDYDVLFLQGGGTLQFDTIPLNLARKEKTVAAGNLDIRGSIRRGRKLHEAAVFSEFGQAMRLRSRHAQQHD